MNINGHEFEMHRDLIEVTSLSRPDTSWRFVDSHGHEHRWYSEGESAPSYHPGKSYDVPSTVIVEDPPTYVDDGDGRVDELHNSHRECVLCRDVVTPRCKSDDYQQYIAGIAHYHIDGMTVDKETFEREYARAIEGR